MITADHFVIYSTLSGVNCGQVWYFCTLPAFQVLLADNFGILGHFQALFVDKFWYFGPILLENEKLIRKLHYLR